MTVTSVGNAFAFRRQQKGSQIFSRDPREVNPLCLFGRNIPLHAEPPREKTQPSMDILDQVTTGAHSSFPRNTKSGVEGPCKSKDLRFGIERILAQDSNKDQSCVSHLGQNSQLAPEPRPFRHLPPPFFLQRTPFLACQTFGMTSQTPAASRIRHPFVMPRYSSRNFQPYGAINSYFTAADGTNSSTKRKRSWSRTVFSALQRKGLERRFKVQKYVSKPDRRQLAAMLGLTDAQVKVWFQNRRMKWRHSQEYKTEELGGDDNSASNEKSKKSDSGPEKTHQ